MRKTLRGMIVIMFLNLRGRMGTTYDLVRDHLNQKFNYQRKQIDTGPGFRKYNVGNLVYVRDSCKKKGAITKVATILTRSWYYSANFERLGI